MSIEGMHFSLDDSDKAYNFNKNNKETDKETVLRWFLDRCASKDVKRAFRQDDRNENGQVREGVTTYGVETNSQELLTIYFYENYNNSCKDEMNVLNSAVKNAQERINRRNSLKTKIALGVAAAAIIAGGIKLYHDHHNTKAPVEEPTTIETTYEPNTESKTEPLTGADYIRYSQEQHINEHAQQQKADLDELRQSYLDEYRVQSTGTIPEVQQPSVQIPDTATYSYSFNDVVDNADATKASINEYNEYQNEQQKQYLMDLRQSYSDEYSGGYTK